MKESGKMLDVQAWSSNLSGVHHAWPNFSNKKPMIR